MKFVYNNSYQTTIKMAPYKALYSHKCSSRVHQDEIGEAKLLGPKIVQQTAKIVTKIRERIKSAQSRQKSYVDARCKNLEFAVGEKLFLKVARM